MSERDEDDPLHQLDKAIGRMESETDAILDSIRDDFTPPSNKKIRDVNTNAFFDTGKNGNKEDSHPAVDPKTMDDSEDWDDEIRDEIQNLVSVTEALRQDLDSQNVESMTTALSEEEDTQNGTKSVETSKPRGMGESIVITSMAIVVWAIVVRLVLHVSYGELDAKGQLVPPMMLRWILNH